MVTDIATDRDQAIYQCREGTESNKGLLLGKSQLLHKEDRQYPLHAVITEALPEFDEKYHEKGFGLL